MTFVPDKQKECNGRKCLLIYACVGSAFCIGYWLTAAYRQTTAPAVRVKHNNNFDYLLFTQQWPIGYCTVWIEEATGGRTCNFAKNKYAWTVHGIWPSKNNSMGPQFCKRIKFNSTALAPIQDDLNEHWSTIQQNGETKFLEHEWEKHGTCAMVLPPFETEFDYFSMGLEWNKKYDIYNALNSAEIVPRDNATYSLVDVSNSVKEYFGVHPQISCSTDKVRNRIILLEIRLCITKELQLMDCESESDLPCDTDEIYYPYTVPNQ